MNFGSPFPLTSEPLDGDPDRETTMFMRALLRLATGSKIALSRVSSKSREVVLALGFSARPQGVCRQVWERTAGGREAAKRRKPQREHSLRIEDHRDIDSKAAESVPPIERSDSEHSAYYAKLPYSVAMLSEVRGL